MGAKAYFAELIVKLLKVTTLILGGTQLTSTGNEINQLHGQGAVAADFAKLHGLTASAAELNQYTVGVDISDLSAEADYYVVCPHAGDIAKIYTVIDGAVLTADAVITASIGGTPVTNGAVTITQAGSAAGDVDSATPSAANTVTAGQAVKLNVTGAGAAGTGPGCHVELVITR